MSMQDFLTMASLTLAALSRVTHHTSRITDGIIDNAVAASFQLHQGSSKMAQESSRTPFLLLLLSVALAAALPAILNADTLLSSSNDLQKLQEEGKAVRIAETGLNGQR